MPRRPIDGELASRSEARSIPRALGEKLTRNVSGGAVAKAPKVSPSSLPMRLFAFGGLIACAIVGVGWIDATQFRPLLDLLHDPAFKPFLL